MKQFLPIVFFILLCPFISFSQSPLLWAKTFGGSSTDVGEGIQQTADSGFIIAGYSSSISPQISGHGGLDFLVIKIDKNGNVQWQKAYGGSSDDAANSVELVPGGYIVGGWSQSNDGDVAGNHGGRDYWIIKIDSVGTLLWQKCLGGSNNDELTSLEPTTDSGYIVSGFSLSFDGQVSGNHGGSQFGDDWIVKLNSTGDIQWQESFGGSNDEYPREVHETKDSGYIVSGFSSSTNGNITNNHGGEDYWIFKLNSSGVMQWQQSFGGTGNDAGEGIKQTPDGGYIVNGYSDSYSGGQIPGNKGENDFWVIKITSTGTLQWSKNFGGSLNDQGGPVQLTPDGGYMVSGHSQSNDGDVTGHHGGPNEVNFDYWILKLDSTGKLQWEKCFGGSGDDINYNTILNKNLGYTLVGYSASADGDVVGNQGGDDYWVVNLGTDSLLAGTPPVTPVQTISAFAGTGVQGYNGDNIAATSAQLWLSDGVAADKAGNVYIADTYNNRVRKVSKNGIITTVAGNGGNGYSGDYGPATSAQIYEPEAVAVDDSGSLYIADFGNQVVRKVNPQGIITTIAGNHTGGFGGDGGQATAAELSGPYDVCIDPSGNLIIADWRNNRIRRVNKQGIISTIAGTGVAGYNGDGEKAVSAELNNPYGVTVDKAGNIYISDSYNNRIRKISIVDSTISTFAGTGTNGSAGDGGLATAAELYTPIGMKFDAAGDLVFADFDNQKVRKISATGIITTIAGTGIAGYTGNDGNPLAAEMNHPIRVAIDSIGNLYVAERDNDIVRKISGNTTLPVTLTNFTAYTLGKGVQTVWTGYDEINMSGYEVERSANGYQFNTIGSVAAKNNGAAQNSYTLFDASPLQGDNYYRVKAISKDGTIQYSGTVLVKIGSDAANIAVYPNPVANKTIQVHLTNIDAGVYQYMVYSSNGKQVSAGSYTHAGGSAVVAINAAGVTRGIYHVVFKGGKNGYTLKVLVL